MSVSNPTEVDVKVLPIPVLYGCATPSRSSVFACPWLDLCRIHFSRQHP